MKSFILIVVFAALSVDNYAVAQDSGIYLPTEIITRDEVFIQNGIFFHDDAVTQDKQIVLDEILVEKDDTPSDVIGHSSKRDVLLLRNEYSVTSHPNIFHSRVITVWSFLRIERVRVSNLSCSQSFDTRIIGGGLGQNYVSVMIQSRRDFGFNVILEIWGRL